MLIKIKNDSKKLKLEAETMLEVLLLEAIVSKLETGGGLDLLEFLNKTR